MDYCRVVGPRGLCSWTRSKGSQQTLRCQGCSKAEQSRTTFREEVVALCEDGGQGRQGQGQGQADWRDRPLRPAQKLPGPWNQRLMAGLGHYSPRIPGGFTLLHCSDGTLGRCRVGASSAHANGQRRSRQFKDPKPSSMLLVLGPRREVKSTPPSHRRIASAVKADAQIISLVLSREWRNGLLGLL